MVFTGIVHVVGFLRKCPSSTSSPSQSSSFSSSSSQVSPGLEVELLRERIGNQGGSNTTTVATATDSTASTPLDSKLDCDEVRIGDSIAINGVCLTVTHRTVQAYRFFVMQETLRLTNLGELFSADSESVTNASTDEAVVRVNVESALRSGSPLGGHLVSGHVDGCGQLSKRTPLPDGSLLLWVDLSRFLTCSSSASSSPSSTLTPSGSTGVSSSEPLESNSAVYDTSANYNYPLNVYDLVIHKGSVTLDGVSLTVCALNADPGRGLFSLCVSLIPHTQQNTTLGSLPVGSLLNVEFDQQLKLRQSRPAASVLPPSPLVTCSRASSAGWASSVGPPATSALCAASSPCFSAVDGNEWDRIYMEMALTLSEHGRLTAPPNPWVGAVLVAYPSASSCAAPAHCPPIGPRLLGCGYHERAGGPHAEVCCVQNALSRWEANEGDDGSAESVQHLMTTATLYVTLEPCNHYGRTPPCTHLIVAHRIPRVVVGMLDPDERVSGNGVAYLREHGVQVEVGVLGARIHRSLRPYTHHRQQQAQVLSKQPLSIPSSTTTSSCRSVLPLVILKVALSLDGKVACADGTSQWITEEKSRQHAHSRVRATSHAVLLGSGTALADNPRLTVRHQQPLQHRDPSSACASMDQQKDASGPAPSSASSKLQTTSGALPYEQQPLRVVLDGRGRVRSGHLLDSNQAPTLIFTTEAGAQRSGALWKSMGVEHIVVSELTSSSQQGSMNLREILRILGERGCFQVMVEGGGQLHASLLEQELADELHVYWGSTVLGGSARPWIQADSICGTISEARFWKLAHVQRSGDRDVFARYIRCEPDSQRLSVDESASVVRVHAEKPSTAATSTVNTPTEIPASMDSNSEDIVNGEQPEVVAPVEEGTHIKEEGTHIKALPADLPPIDPALFVDDFLASDPQNRSDVGRPQLAPPSPQPRCLQIGVAYTRWNASLVDPCVEAVLSGLREAGLPAGRTLLLPVSGSWELPFACRTLASRGVSAVIAVGILLKGETLHFEMISEAVVHSLCAVERDTGTPVVYGVVNCITLQQARDRCLPPSTLPASWARAALHMASLRLSASQPSEQIEKSVIRRV